MIQREHLLKAIRKKGYMFKRQTERIELYKLKGGTNRVQLRKIALHDNKAAKAILKAAGYSDSEIEDFIAECNTNTH